MYTDQPKCQVVPLAHREVAFVINGQERLRWCAGLDSPRPFFFPIIGPAGYALTRMGHPGAPNHDHHRSIWFAHNKILGIDFWADTTPAIIRQREWLAYDDSDDAARMAVRIDWLDGHDPQPLIVQELIASVEPHADGELLVELQSTFAPVAETLELGQTNFGWLAVRMAKSLSSAFGSGVLTGADGQVTEAKLFGKPNEWMDYSGEIILGTTEGITYFDHPSNLSFPGKWHVRDDGWMGLSACRDAPVMLNRANPTTWRYLLHAHSGPADNVHAKKIAAEFQQRGSFQVVKGTKPHQTATIVRS